MFHLHCSEYSAQSDLAGTQVQIHCLSLGLAIACIGMSNKSLEKIMKTLFTPTAGV